jgi:ParB-like chromosome segregation protein Spo0J
MKNRIARVGLANPADLVAHNLNWRDHPQEQRDALETALENLGWLKRIIVNENTGRIIDGHLRAEQALALGIKEVPVVWVNLSEREEAVALATLDPLSLDATADKDKLRDLIDSVPDTLNEDLDALLNDLAKRQGVASEKPTKTLSEAPEAILCPRCGHGW